MNKTFSEKREVAFEMCVRQKKRIAMLSGLPEFPPLEVPKTTCLLHNGTLAMLEKASADGQQGTCKLPFMLTKHAESGQQQSTTAPISRMENFVAI